MTINDKIKQILIDKNVTPSYFADEIGVQRSSISHILSGRNRPSFDIIQKIIRRFPDLGYEWIMEEESPAPVRQAYNAASFNRSLAGANSNSLPNSDSYQSAPVLVNSPGSVRPLRSEIPAPVVNVSASDAESPGSSSASIKAERRVERILIFYTDGTFQDYKPA